MNQIVARTLGSIVWTLLTLLDVCVNRLFNGRIETISSRAGRAQASGRRWGCVLCRALDAIQKDHCENAMNDPLGRLD